MKAHHSFCGLKQPEMLTLTMQASRCWSLICETLWVEIDWQWKQYFTEHDKTWDIKKYQGGHHSHQIPDCISMSEKKLKC